MTPPISQSTLETNQLPRWMRWANSGGHLLQQSGIQLVKLTEASLLADAQNQTQLSDWGDESFRIGLQTLLASLNQEANLSLMGRFLMKQSITRLLVNRLRIQATLKQHPDILEIPIQRPLIVTGLPRTGTTLLHRLLAQDSRFRWLHLWELMQPCPPPTQANATIDPRIQKTQTSIQQSQTIIPGFSTAHLLDAQLPEEGNALFEHAFTSISFELRSHIPSYGAWLRSQTLQSQYRYYRQQLQLLSWQWPGRWLLKAPIHLRHLDALLQVFPDACIVQLHRDPCAVVPSACSLIAMNRGVYTDRLDLSEIGRYFLDSLAHLHKQGLYFRTQTPAASIFDVNYTNLVQDPLKTIHQIYDFFGDSLSEESVNRMQQWVTTNPQTKHGIHRYSLAQFGLDEAKIQERFS